MRLRDRDIEEDVEQRARNVLRELNSVPEHIQQYLKEFLVESYYSGEASGFIESFRKEINTITRKGGYKSRVVEEILEHYNATPQIRRVGNILCPNYSYLDIIVSKKAYGECLNRISNSKEAYRCSIAWVFGLSLLVLLDSYIEFVNRSGGWV